MILDMPGRTRPQGTAVPPQGSWTRPRPKSGRVRRAPVPRPGPVPAAAALADGIDQVRAILTAAERTGLLGDDLTDPVNDTLEFLGALTKDIRDGHDEHVTESMAKGALGVLKDQLRETEIVKKVPLLRRLAALQTDYGLEDLLFAIYGDRHLDGWSVDTKTVLWDVVNMVVWGIAAGVVVTLLAKASTLAALSAATVVTASRFVRLVQATSTLRGIVLRFTARHLGRSPLGRWLFKRVGGSRLAIMELGPSSKPLVVSARAAEFGGYVAEVGRHFIHARLPWTSGHLRAAVQDRLSTFRLLQRARVARGLPPQMPEAIFGNRAAQRRVGLSRRRIETLRRWVEELRRRNPPPSRQRGAPDPPTEMDAEAPDPEEDDRDEWEGESPEATVEEDDDDVTGNLENRYPLFYFWPRADPLVLDDDAGGHSPTPAVDPGGVTLAYDEATRLHLRDLSKLGGAIRGQRPSARSAVWTFELDDQKDHDDT